MSSDELQVLAVLTGQIAAIIGYLLALTLTIYYSTEAMRKPFMKGIGVDALWSAFLIVPFILGALMGLPWYLTFVLMVSYLAVWSQVDRRLRGKPGDFSIAAYWIERDGWGRYLLGWWCTAAIPLFFLVRLTELLVYPVLVVAWGLPPLRASDYIMLSRHKWEGLVGADLVYCLYCEWMTGVWSLGSAQLQNIESMWCPLRFRSEVQCEKCKAFFPDVNAWARPEDGMPGVEKFYRENYDDRPMQQRSALNQRTGKQKR